MPRYASGLILALLVTAAAGWLAVSMSRQYYLVAPYHFDSASYRASAVTFAKMRASEGLRAAWNAAWQTKDPLDVSLRVLFAPGSLLHPYGHLVVLLPAMAIFLFLLAQTVEERTGSAFWAITIVAFLFSFPLVYAPLLGIADYTKDGLATWLLGIAALAWLRSDDLSRRGWTVVAGVSFGLLACQRVVAAFYAGLLFAPLAAIAFRRLARAHGTRLAIVRIFQLAIPCLAIAGAVIAAQGSSLYQYYTVRGYDYASPVAVASYLFTGWRSGPFLQALATVGIAFVFLLLIGRQRFWRQETRRPLLESAWLIVGLPLVVMASQALYHGFQALWTPLLLVGLAICVPAGTQRVRLLAVGLLAIAVVGGAYQYRTSTPLAGRNASAISPARALFTRLGDVISHQPEPRRYALLFDEVGSLFRNQARFDAGVPLDQEVVRISIHDTYYVADFGAATPEDIVEQKRQILESEPGTIAVATCNYREAGRQRPFLNDGQRIAAPVAELLARYLHESSGWRIIVRLPSHYGPLCVYQRS